MNFLQLLQRLVALLAVMLVASCGGGGGSPGTQTGSSGTPQAYRIGIVVLNSSNASVNSIAPGANYVVRAVLQESGGKPVANRLVTFEIAGDLAKVSPNTALTNESGIAEVVIAAASSSSLGATSVKATAAVGTEQVSVSMDFAVTAATGAQPLLSVAIFNAANVSVTDIANSSKFTARAVLLDASGKPAVGRIVSFSVAGGAAVVAPATALTDSTGRAEVAISPVSNASIGASTVLVSAELNGANLRASLNFQVLASSLNLLSVGIFNSQNVAVTEVTNGSKFTARAVLLDDNGRPVVGRIVSFLVSNGVAVVAPTTALTDSTGRAEVVISPLANSSIGAGTVIASAELNGADLSARFNFQVTATPSNLLTVGIFDAANISVTDIANSSKFTARAVLLDASGKPAVGRIVSFSVSGGAAVVAPIAALTDSTGRAEVAISPASNASIGASTVIASAELNGANLSASLNFRVLASSLTDTTITLALINSSGASVNSISVGGGNVVRAFVRDGFGAPVANRLVSFSLTGPSIAVLNPTTALTNSSGVAEVPIAPLSVTSLGAATVVASATVGSLTITQQLDFAVSASGLSLSAVTAQSTSLASGGNTSVSVTALVGSSPATVPVNITFAASCGKINGVDTAASGVSVSTNGSGVATANYSAVAADGSLCSGVVSVTASSAGASPRSVSLTIAAPVANAITFVSATPAQIFVKGSGAAEQSVAKFKVLSSVGTPLSGVDIVFSIVTNPGGVGINASGSTANVSKTTDQLGEVSVALFSGTIPGPVKVRAALASNSSVFAESQNLTVASGPPSQRFMSLSVEKFNIEGWAVDGSSTKLTVRLADRQGNAVEDGTVVNFTAEGGQVASSCATARVGGISSCSVDFISQNPRPVGGRVSVLAFTAGTKDYTDVNGNNQYDAGIDTLVQQGDAFRDDNEDNAFVDGEFIVPRGGTAPCAGAGGSFPSRVNTCDSNLSTTVRQMAVILFSSSSPTIQVQTFSATGLNFRLRSANNNLLPMPANTSVSATASGGSCEIDRVIGGVVPNISPSPGNLSEDLASSVSIPLKNCATGNSVFVTVTSPGGLVSSFGFTIP